MSKEIWGNLARNGEAVITNNGKPTALMIDISEDNFDEMLKAVRQAKAMVAFNKMRMDSSKEGFMSEEDINAEIHEYRKEKKGE
ncbi:hypothetical protein M9Y10_031337 [Tritrichomonas musculus]|uniref:Prevent-host-death family protein n=1 Tax=Tritrichomonas musculus TaxID=1915356 RepID=A0ABR2GKA7_9EUKA